MKVHSWVLLKSNKRQVGSSAPISPVHAVSFSLFCSSAPWSLHLPLMLLLYLCSNPIRPVLQLADLPPDLPFDIYVCPSPFCPHPNVRVGHFILCASPDRLPGPPACSHTRLFLGLGFNRLKPKGKGSWEWAQSPGLSLDEGRANLIRFQNRVTSQGVMEEVVNGDYACHPMSS